MKITYEKREYTIKDDGREYCIDYYPLSDNFSIQERKLADEIHEDRFHFLEVSEALREKIIEIIKKSTNNG